MNVIKTSGYTTSSVNGKTINQQAYDAKYNGNEAIIKVLNNGKMQEILLDKSDVNHILTPFFKNKLKNSSQKMLLDKLSSDFNVNVTPHEYYSNLKNTSSELKDLFTDVSKLKKVSKKNKKKQGKKNKTKKNKKKK
jgi:hypothetical protein